MSTHAERLLRAESRLSLTIIALRKDVIAVCEQRGRPHQDDWDDTLQLASDYIARARNEVQSALRVLEDGA